MWVVSHSGFDLHLISQRVLGFCVFVYPSVSQALPLQRQRGKQDILWNGNIPYQLLLIATPLYLWKWVSVLVTCQTLLWAFMNPGLHPRDSKVMIIGRVFEYAARVENHWCGQAWCSTGSSTPSVGTAYSFPGTGGWLENTTIWVTPVHLSMKRYLNTFFSLDFGLSFWVISGPNKPRAGTWVCVFRISIPMFIFTKNTLFFPSIIAVRWVMLSILFPMLLSGSRIKDSSLLEQKSYLFLKKVSHYYVALQHGPDQGEMKIIGSVLGQQKHTFFLFSLDFPQYPFSQRKNSKYILPDLKNPHQWISKRPSYSKC